MVAFEQKASPCLALCGQCSQVQGLGICEEPGVGLGGPGVPSDVRCSVILCYASCKAFWCVLNGCSSLCRSMGGCI